LDSRRSTLAAAFEEDDQSDDDDYQPGPIDWSTSLLRAVISETIIPDYIDRPPKNLGDSSHGKLKSDTWIKLFTIFIPLAAIQVWRLGGDGQLENLFSLVSLVNLASAYSISSRQSASLLEHVHAYRRSLAELHPHLKVVPIQHLAYHLSEDMDLVGSISSLATWAGERLNRELGLSKTNGHIGEFPSTLPRPLFS